MAEPVTRAEAQARAEEIRAFALELARLETARVVSLSDEQHRSTPRALDLVRPCRTHLTDRRRKHPPQLFSNGGC
jgi:hypothetical protein